jgi:hypothetical protein
VTLKLTMILSFAFMPWLARAGRHFRRDTSGEQPLGMAKVCACMQMSKIKGRGRDPVRDGGHRTRLTSELTARILSTGMTLLKSIGLVTPITSGYDCEFFDRVRATARAAVGEDSLRQAWEAGQAKSTAEAVREALNLASTLADEPVKEPIV